MKSSFWNGFAVAGLVYLASIGISAHAEELEALNAGAKGVSAATLRSVSMKCLVQDSVDGKPATSVLGQLLAQFGRSQPRILASGITQFEPNNVAYQLMFQYQLMGTNTPIATGALAIVENRLIIGAAAEGEREPFTSTTDKPIPMITFAELATPPTYDKYGNLVTEASFSKLSVKVPDGFEKYGMAVPFVNADTNQPSALTLNGKQYLSCLQTEIAKLQ